MPCSKAPQDILTTIAVSNHRVGQSLYTKDKYIRLSPAIQWSIQDINDCDFTVGRRTATDNQASRPNPKVATQIYFGHPKAVREELITELWNTILAICDFFLDK